MTMDNLRFQEYLHKKKSFKCGQKRYMAYTDKSIRDLVDLFLEYRIVVEKCAKSTVDGDKRKLRRLFGFLVDGDVDDATLFDVIGDDPERFQDTLSELKQYLLRETEYSQNYVSGLMTVTNVFFKRFLQMDVGVAIPAKTATSFERVKIGDIDTFLNHINKKYSFKLGLSDSDEEKQGLRRNWAVERFIVLTMKYTWARSIEIRNMLVKDALQMEKTGVLLLRSHKRENNPKEYQSVVVPEAFVREWQLYKEFRDSSDWSDDAPAITRHQEPVKTRFIRYLMHKYDKELVLPKDFTCHNIRRSMHTLARHVFHNPKVAQLQLGDVSSKIADTHYNIPDVSLIRSELDRLYQSDHIPGENCIPSEITKNIQWEDMSYA